MSFYYVDRIFLLEKDKSIQGIKNVTKSEPFLYGHQKTGVYLNPAVLCEAILQLGSWLCIHSSDFKQRPVIIHLSDIEFLELVRPGDQVAMKLDIVGSDDNILHLQGEARVNETTVFRAGRGQAYLLPMEEFDDELRVRKQFEHLYRPEFKDVSRVQPESLIKLPQNFDGKLKQFAIDKIQHIHEEKSIKSLKQFPMSESFFKDHFPFKPVVPAVIQLTAIMETSQVLAEHINPSIILIPKYVKRGRLRKFVEPGMTCITTAAIKKGSPLEPQDILEIDGFVEHEDQKMMTATVGFEQLHIDDPKPL